MEMTLWDITMPWDSLSLCGPSSTHSSLSEVYQCKNSHPTSVISFSYPAGSNLVYIGIFFFVELAFGLVAASYFAAADGHAGASVALAKSGGVFAFLAGLLGFYTVGHLMCQTALFFSFPMGNTSKYFVKKRHSNAEK